MYLTSLLLILNLLTLATDLRFFIVKKGFIKASPVYEDLVIRDGNEYKKVTGELGIEGKLPSINFEKEFVVLLSPKVKEVGSIHITKVMRNKDDILEIRYLIKPSGGDEGKKLNDLQPFLLAKVVPSDKKELKIKIGKEEISQAVQSGTGIGQIPYYSNVLKAFGGITILDYFPIDKGNVWTYEIESDGKKREEKNSIKSIADGWSIFDNFFGKKEIGFMIDEAGNVLVSKDGQVQTFYTSDTRVSFIESKFQTPAGGFDDLMVVTVPKNDRLWFTDVYAKGVGLIYHEHTSPKGNAKYSLLKATVRGKNFPK